MRKALVSVAIAALALIVATGATAREQALLTPVDVTALDGQIFVADEDANAIAVYTTDGRYLRSLSVTSPTAVEAGPDQLLYVTEGSGQPIVVLDPRSGAIVRRIGHASLAPGPGGFFHPTSLAVGSHYLWVTDDTGWIQQFTLRGHFLRRFGHPFAMNKRNSLASIGFPDSLAAHRDLLYVGDGSQHRVVVFNAKGQALRAYGPHLGSSDLDDPDGLASDGLSLYVSDAYRNSPGRSGRERLLIVTLKSGKVRDEWGAWCRYCTLGTGSNTPGAFARPRGIVVSGGRVYVADRDNRRVQVFDGNGRYLLSLD